MGNLHEIKTPTVSVLLDKERHLRYDLNAYAEIEEIFGTVENAMNKLDTGSIKAIRTLLWAGLIHEDESINERQVGAWIGLIELNDVMDKISEAMGYAMPEESTENANQGNELGQ